MKRLQNYYISRHSHLNCPKALVDRWPLLLSWLVEKLCWSCGNALYKQNAGGLFWLVFLRKCNGELCWNSNLKFKETIHFVQPYRIEGRKKRISIVYLASLISWFYKSSLFVTLYCMFVTGFANMYPIQRIKKCLSILIVWFVFSTFPDKFGHPMFQKDINDMLCVGFWRQT